MLLPFRVFRRCAPLVAAAGLSLTACEFDVANPSVINASAIDPISSGNLATLSAQTTLWRALGTVFEASGWVSGEAWVTKVLVDAPPFGRRDMPAGSGVTEEHMITREFVIAEAARAGFDLVATRELPGEQNYFLIFTPKREP